MYLVDNDGNVSDSDTIEFTTDTVDPFLSVSNPSGDVYQTGNTITVTGTTNDDTSEPVTVKINFALYEKYLFEELPYRKHPQNHNIMAKIRQQLHFLRDRNTIEFVSRGEYGKYR